MSDFSTFNDFRKGYKLGKNNQYSDPTYLSFALMFDFTDGSSSPLLSGTARAFIKQNTDADGKEAPIQSHAEYSTGYGPRLKALDDFILTLKKINQEMPWYWQSLSGIDAIQKYDPNKPYRGGDESKLTIGTLESLDLTIAGLMHLYRTAVFDEERWSYILPCNLRKFRVWVYVTEVRPIKNLSKMSASLGFDKNAAKDSIGVDGGAIKFNLKDAFSPEAGVTNENDNISGSKKRPFFMFELGSCEWDMTLGTAQFADLQKSPEGFAASEIGFTYEKVGRVSARVLNGTIVEAEQDAARLSPATAGESEEKTIMGILEDNLENKIESLQARANMLSPDELIASELDVLVGRAEEFGEDIYKASTVSLENIYADAVAGVDTVTDVGTLSENIPENIFGLAPEEATVQDALDQSAVAGLNVGENINADSNTTNSGTDGGNTLGNIHGK